MKVISISEFKATCLAVLEEVRTSGVGVIVTKRGVPVAEVTPPSASTLGQRAVGQMMGTATIVGDIVSPVADAGEWEAHTE